MYFDKKQLLDNIGFSNFEIEDIVLGMADAIYEKRRLEDEVNRLKDFEKKYHDLVDRRFKDAQQSSINVLNACIAGTELVKRNN